MLHEACRKHFNNVYERVKNPRALIMEENDFPLLSAIIGNMSFFVYLCTALYWSLNVCSQQKKKKQTV